MDHKDFRDQKALLVRKEQRENWETWARKAIQASEACREILATQATRVRKVEKVQLVLQAHLAQRVLLGYKVKMDQRENKE